jgi:hypothetical protein
MRTICPSANVSYRMNFSSDMIGSSGGAARRVGS